MADQDPRLTEQAVRKGELEIRKLEREARAAEIAAATPALPTQLGGGTLAIPEKASPLGVLAAHRSLDVIAARIAEALPREATSVWIVRDDAVTRRRTIHAMVTATLERMTDELTAAAALLGRAPSAGGAGVTGRTDLAGPGAQPSGREVPEPGAHPEMVTGAAVALNLAASAIPLIGSLMRTNTTIRATETTIAFPAVAAAVARELLASGTRVLLDGTPLPRSQALLDSVRVVQQARDSLARALARFRAEQVDSPPPAVAATAERLESLRAFLKEAVKTPAHLDGHEATFAALDAAATAAARERALWTAAERRASAVAAVLADVDATLEALLTPDAGGVSAVAAAAEWEQNRQAHVLVLTPGYGGAESTYEDVQLRRDRGLHVGSAVVTWVVVGPDGVVLAAGNAQGQAAATTTVGTTRVTWSDAGPEPRAAGAGSPATPSVPEEVRDHRGWAD